MDAESKAELIMALEDYECKERERWDRGLDLAASDARSDEKVLLRLVTKPKSKSGFVGIDTVREMVETMKREEYDKGVLISKRFSKAAKEEMRRRDIQIISEKIMPSYGPQDIYLRIGHYVNELCKATCGKVPKKETDCKCYSEGTHSCKVRVVSDDASFHFKHGWTTLLQNDLDRLLSIQTL